MPEKPSLIDQPDFFISFIIDLPLRDQREMMEWPFFSLSKRKRIKPINYTSPDGNVFVNVSANPEHGMATIWDADILIWAASMLNEYKNDKINHLPRTLNFHSYDLLKAIGRNPGGKQYDLLPPCFARLQSTTVRTNIRKGTGKRRYRQFSWLDSWDEKLNSKKQSLGMSITLSDWFYEGVIMEGGLLQIHEEYFSIQGGRERWLYRVLRKHIGRKKKDFVINLSTLFEKSGTDVPFRKFKFEIEKIVERNELPQIELSKKETNNGVQLIAGNRTETNLQDHSENRLKLDGSISTMPGHLTDFIRKYIQDKFPDANIDDLKKKFDAWIRDDPRRQPENYASAFEGFVKKHMSLLKK